MSTVIPQAFRQAIRALRRSPGFTVTAIAILGIGVAVTTTIFSAVSAALLRPLPYPDGDRLVALQETRGPDQISVSYPDFVDWRAQNKSFSQLAAFTGTTFNLTGTGEPERLRGNIVTANLFATLRVSPLLGRDFRPEDDELGAPNVVAIGFALWRDRFAKDPGIIGRAILLNNVATTVIAVMPNGFVFPDGVVFGPAQFWTPMSALGGPDRGTRDSHPGLVALGRLQPGTTVAAARADLAGIAARLQTTYPASNAKVGVSVKSALDTIVGDVRGSLVLLLGAVALVLMIACANVAALMLTRALSRRRNLAIRLALGAGRGRAVIDAAAEGVLISSAGGIVGAALAYLLVRLGGHAAVGLPRLAAMQLEPRTLAFVLLITSISAIVFAMIPVAGAWQVDPEQWLKGRGTTAGAAAGRARSILVISEIALAVVLLVGAGLLLKSFARLAANTGGINPSGVLTMAIRLPDQKYDNDAARQFFTSLTDHLAATPGVVAAGGITTLPFSGFGAQSGITPFGTPPTPETVRRTDVAAVTPGYFRAVGMTLVRGRLFDTRDDATAIKTVVVDDQFAAAFWPGADPIGQRISGWGFDALTVIGVVHHVANYGVAAESRQEMFVTYAQRPPHSMTIAIRTAGEPSALAAGARRVLHDLDPDLPAYNVRTMEDVVGSTESGPRLAAALSGTFALIALALAAIGLYGLMAYVVAVRRRDIGVRQALGATPSMVIRLVLQQGLTLAVAGVAIGLTLAFASATVIRSQVFGVDIHDPMTFIGAPIVLLVIGAGSLAIPALRAARISPVTALGDD